MAAGTYFFKLSMNKLLNSSFKLLIAQASSNVNESKADQNSLGQTYIQSLKVGVGSLSLLIGWAIRIGPATTSYLHGKQWYRRCLQELGQLATINLSPPLNRGKYGGGRLPLLHNFTLILFNNIKLGLKESLKYLFNIDVDLIFLALLHFRYHSL